MRGPTPLLILRVTALGVLLFLLLKPSLLLTKHNFEKPRLALVLNQSNSMATQEKEGGTRWQKAIAWLKKNQKNIEERARIYLYVCGEHAQRKSMDELYSLQPSESILDFQKCLREVLQDDPQQVWLFSDGVEERIQDMPESLEPLPISLNILGIGQTDESPGPRISNIHTPDFVFLHIPFEMQVQWEVRRRKGESIPLRVFQGKKLIGEQILSIASEYALGQSTFTLYPASLGKETYRVTFGATASEVSADVLRQKWRILYLAGRPSFEYAHLRDFLKSNPNYELISFVILRNPENIIPVPEQELSLIPFPAQEIFIQDLFRFDLFILENFAWSRFQLPANYLESLKSFVHRGGGLLLIGGENALSQGSYKGTPLEEILPVVLSSQGPDFQGGPFKTFPLALEHPLLQGLGELNSSRRIWKELPDLDGYHTVKSLKPGSVILLAHPFQKTESGQPLPILSAREIGKGRSMLLGSPSTWKWKLGAGLHPDLSFFYSRFWSMAIQYLTGDLNLKRVRWSPLPSTPLRRDPLPLTLHLFEENFRPLEDPHADIQVRWFPPGASVPQMLSVQEEQPGQYRVNLENLKSGRHRLKVWARSRGKVIGEDDLQFQWKTASSQPEPLQRNTLIAMSHAAHGEYSDLGKISIPQWLKTLPPVRPSQEVVGKKILWDSPFCLGLLLFLFILEWMLRRLWGYS
ncbi:MAG: hypothetical protein HY400_03170 [Elusimicrobia bacterium]|nr:hypothetical protein [Elusimicrobiota bacterium]